MITYDEFKAWLAAQGIDATRCTQLEIAPTYGRDDAPIYLRVTQIAVDERGNWIYDMKANVLMETVNVPLVSLP